jgi:hypothetical protein
MTQPCTGGDRIPDLRELHAARAAALEAGEPPDELVRPGLPSSGEGEKFPLSASRF